MEKLKGVVIEKSGSSCIVLSNDGSFRRLRAKGNLKVGQEVGIPTWYRYSWRTVAGVAALFLLVLTTAVGWNLWQASVASAMVSLDINPSVEITLNSRNVVLKAQALDPEAQELLQRVAVKGKPVRAALASLVSASVSMKYLNPEHSWVVVGVSPLAGQTAPQGLDADHVVDLLDTISQAQGISPHVVAFQLTAAEYDQARARDLSAGEYALWLNAQKAGINVPASAVAQTAGRNSLLDNPAVQEQIRANYSDGDNGMRKAISPAIPPKKTDASTDDNPEKSQAPAPDSPAGRQAPENSRQGQSMAPPGKGTERDSGKTGGDNTSRGQDTNKIAPSAGNKTSGDGSQQDEDREQKGNNRGQRSDGRDESSRGELSMFGHSDR